MADKLWKVDTEPASEFAHASRYALIAETMEPNPPIATAISMGHVAARPRSPKTHQRAMDAAKMATEIAAAAGLFQFFTGLGPQ